MEDVKRLRRPLQRPDPRIILREQPRTSQQTIVGCRTLPALLIPAFDMMQFYAENGGLNCVHAAVPSDFFVVIAARAAVIAQVSHALCGVEITRCNQSSIAIRAEVLGGIKTEGRHLAD